MADFITQFAADEGVSRSNFNSRITQANTALSTVQGAANASIPASQRGAANGVATLNGAGLLDARQAANLAINSFGVVTGTDLFAWAIAQTQSGSFLVPPTVTSNIPSNAMYYFGRIDLCGGTGANTDRSMTLFASDGSGRIFNCVTASAVFTYWYSTASLDAYGKVKPEQTSSAINSRPASFTLALTDAGKFQWCGNNSDPITVTIPTNASVAFSVGTEIEFGRGSPGTLTFAAASGVTIMSIDNMRSVANLCGCAALKQIATNYWLLSGDLG